MHFFQSILLSASAFSALAAAAISITEAPRGSAQAGQTYTIKWSGDTTGDVTILLRQGPGDNLQTVSTITTSASGGTYRWTVPTTLAPAGDYALQITQGSDTNYWQIGAIAGGVPAASSAVSSAASAASSALSRASSAASSASAALSSISSRLNSATATSSGASSSGTASSAAASSGSAAASSAAASTTDNSAQSAAATSSSAPAPSQSDGAAAGLKSNAALVLGAVAAMAYLG